MSTLTALSALDLANFVGGEPEVASANRFIVEGAGYRAQFNGRFEVLGNAVQSGTVQSIRLFTLDGSGKATEVALIAGLSVDAAVVWDLAQVGDGTELWGFILASADSLEGSSGDDSLQGFDSADLLSGGAGADVLVGGSGNDTLRGGVGRDTMFGGSGDDEYAVDRTLETVAEDPNGGYDRVISSVNFALADNLEELSLRGSLRINGRGNETANTLSGNSAANFLEGLSGDDTLIGAGGADTLAGGEGNDEYRVDAADRLQELTNQGTDRVLVSFDFTLPDNFEELVLTGATGQRGTGNSAEQDHGECRLECSFRWRR